MRLPLSFLNLIPSGKLGSGAERGKNGNNVCLALCMSVSVRFGHLTVYNLSLVSPGLHSTVHTCLCKSGGLVDWWFVLSVCVFQSVSDSI